VTWGVVQGPAVRRGATALGSVSVYAAAIGELWWVG